MAFYKFASLILACGILALGNANAKPLDRSAEESTASVYSKCKNLNIKKVEDGFIIESKDGDEIIRHDETYISFRIGPQSSNSKKRCGFPISITRDGKYGLIMPDGTVFAGRVFENISALNDGVLGYSENEKWGLIDKSGKVIVAPIYDDIMWYGGGKFIVDIRKETAFLMDNKGQRSELADDPNYFVDYKQHLPPRDVYLACPDDLNLDIKNGRWGIIDKAGKVVLRHDYRAIKCFYGEEGMAAIDDLKKWCPINRKGEILGRDRCVTSYYQIEMSHHWPEKLSDDSYESSVLWNRAYLEYGAGLRAEPPKYMPDGVMAHKPSLASPSSSYWYTRFESDEDAP